MRPSPELALFAHHATRPEAALDLAQAALLVAESEYPGLDVARYVHLLDKYGDEARRRCTGASDPARRLGRLLYEEVGFGGNEREYYDPRNSLLSDVIDRRCGIPVTLAIVWLEVARRAGVVAQGIGFPGHFLVEAQHQSGTTYVDPWTGKLLGPSELRALAARATGHAKDPDPSHLEPVTKRQILIRMLNNLRSIYGSRSDGPRLRRTLEQLVILAPTDRNLRKELEKHGGAVLPVPVNGSRAVN